MKAKAMVFAIVAISISTLHLPCEKDKNMFILQTENHKVVHITIL